MCCHPDNLRPLIFRSNPRRHGLGSVDGVVIAFAMMLFVTLVVLLLVMPFVVTLCRLMWSCGATYLGKSESLEGHGT